jgi:replicative superfamily II helicase
LQFIVNHLPLYLWLTKPEQQEQLSQQQKRKTVVVDSIIKYVKGWELSNTEQNVAVKSFSSATVEDMNDFLRPTTRRQPDKLVIHVGTNNIRSSTPQNIANEVTKVAHQFKQESKKTRIILSSLITRSDNPEFANKVKETNGALKLKCEENNWSFIDNSNINSLHLNRRGLHPTHEESALLQANLGNILKMI